MKKDSCHLTNEIPYKLVVLCQLTLNKESHIAVFKVYMKLFVNKNKMVNNIPSSCWAWAQECSGWSCDLSPAQRRSRTWEPSHSAIQKISLRNSFNYISSFTAIFIHTIYFLIAERSF